MTLEPRPRLQQGFSAGEIAGEEEIMQGAHSQNVIDFEKYRCQSRQKRASSVLAQYALDRCVEAYERSEWKKLGYWFSIYWYERRRARNYDACQRR